MGQRGFFKEGIRRVMATTTGKEFRKNYMKAVNRGIKPDLDNYRSIHRLLDFELRLAMRKASALSSDMDVVARKMAINATVEAYTAAGQDEAAERFLDAMEEYSY
jgi:hypothetical protein